MVVFGGLSKPSGPVGEDRAPEDGMMIVSGSGLDNVNTELLDEEDGLVDKLLAELRELELGLGSELDGKLEVELELLLVSGSIDVVCRA